jgi:hypothetical protein
MQKYIADTGCEVPRANPDFDSSKPVQLGKEHYYNFAKRQRNEREQALRKSKTSE